MVPGMSLAIASQFFVSNVVKSEDAIKVLRIKSSVTPIRDEGSTFPALLILQVHKFIQFQKW